MRVPVMTLIISALVLAGSGCAVTDQFSSGYKTNYLFQPSVLQRAGGDDPLKITDGHIFSFSDDVKHALRLRMNRARLARMFSGTIQVLTAATAAGLAATSANLETITALAGTSAVMPQLQDLFEARERAEFYEQGAGLIEDAQGRYLARVANGEVAAASPEAENSKVSAAGAMLFQETVASIKVVEKALVSRLPTVDELRKATGEYGGDIATPAGGL